VHRGRKPQTIATRRLLGNPGKRSLTAAIPEPKRGTLLCPKSVTDNPRALAYWDHALANVHEEHLAPIDGPLLARYCMALAIADEAMEGLQASTLLVRAPKTGVLMQSPYLGVANRQTELARKLAAELGLPPTARARVLSGLGLKRRVPGDPAEAYFDDA
jgi:P27 family predicted phage terminase small subunit